MVRKLRFVVLSLSLALAFSSAIGLATATPANAVIHEMIGANCRFGGEPPVPGGQVRDGASFLRALQATGVISSIVVTPTLVTINFDLSAPPAKFVSAGFDLLIPDAFGPGVDLLLSPLPTIEGSTFPAFVHCANLNPAP